MDRIRITLVAVIAAYLMLFGCGGGGETVTHDSQARADLPGTWRVVQGGQPGSATMTCPGVFQFGTSSVACTDNTTITIFDNGTFRAFDGTTGSWSVSNGTLTATSGSNTLSGTIHFDTADRVTLTDTQGRFITFVRTA